MNFHKMFKNIALYVVFFALGGFLVYLYLTYSVLPNKISEIRSTPLRLRVTSPLISPLLLSQDNPKTALQDDFMKKVNDYINKKTADKSATMISFYYRNLDTALFGEVNSKETFAPASLMKVPIMIAILKESEKNPNLLNKKIYFDGKIDLNGEEHYKSEVKIIGGNYYTVKELMKYMISYSDNNATNLLFKLVPPDAIPNLFINLKLPLPTPDAGGSSDFMSADLYSRLLRILYNSTYLSEDDSILALTLLSDSDFSQGIVSGVPQGVIVAHKFGERTVYESDGKTVSSEELHDCGIVYKSSAPFLICVMTRGNSFDSLSKIISDLTKLSYDNTGL
ncbi:MAG: Beta-lactamase class A-like protein [Candidatus Nomurabacteria bacterium]|nr:Beta-lactamase class A-like protein [Candidatus Nomurabacteria bacterium]